MNELQGALGPLLEGFFTTVWDIAKEDARKYGQAMAKDLADYLYRAYAKDDEVARESLRDLRAQAVLALTKHAIVVNREARERLLKALEILAQVALATLRITLPTP